MLKPLASHPTQCYLTNVLQVADVLEWVLAQVGKSTVWQTSFSISEEFLRRLYFIEKSGRVNTIHLILDFKATQKTLKLWPFLTKVIEHTYLADNHSKVILIQSEAGEAVVSTDSHVFDTFHRSLQDIITNHSVPLSELFKQKIAE